MTHPPADVGAPIDAIDTPALVVDVDAYERNLDRMARFAAAAGVRLRPHAKTHKAPMVAHHQVARGAVGACCQKVAEAEAMVWGGVRDVLVSNEVVGAPKLARLAALARQAAVAVCVDDANQARALDAAAREAGVRLPVLVEINVGADRCGTEPGEPAAALAEAVATQPGLVFRGLQAYQGRAQHIPHAQKRQEAVALAHGKVRETLDALTRRGLRAEVVTGGGTGTYDLDAASGLYTEIQPGSYAFMDVDYRRVEGAPAVFEHALFVLATVMSRTAPTRAVVDAGLKALAVDSGMPVVRDRPDLEFQRASDEHGLLHLRLPERGPRIGDRLWLIPGHCDPTINLYDWYVGVRGGRVEALWPITARGATR